MKISEKLKSHAFQTFLACALLFHVKILETESGSDYSDLELRLMLGTYEKFIMRDLRTRFVYLLSSANTLKLGSTNPFVFKQITILNAQFSSKIISFSNLYCAYYFSRIYIYRI